MEDKQEIVTYLKWLLKATRAGSGIEKLVLSEDQKTVAIMFSSGGSRDVNVDCDSGIELVKDVIRVLM
ncbi:MAG: hypothetical protein K2J67_11635 [Lachnospiraceae bacterium]|nr:hypothetical protein [Lachnospiraceae bacterium]